MVASFRLWRAECFNMGLRGDQGVNPGSTVYQLPYPGVTPSPCGSVSFFAKALWEHCSRLSESSCVQHLPRRELRAILPGPSAGGMRFWNLSAPLGR